MPDIFCLGLNHRSADIALREQLAFSPSQVKSALTHFGSDGREAHTPVQEMAILSTCNRVEIYAVSEGEPCDHLEMFLAEIKGVPSHDFHPHLYRLRGEEAIEHLLRVAAGLDSMVLGEPQILGQVTEAFTQARELNATGKLLSRLFHTAIHAGKRARSETKISHNPASIASVAVKLISKRVRNLEKAQIMVLGAGEMAELAIEALKKRGVSRIWVVNRTLERAQEMAIRWEGEAYAFEEYPALVGKTDILITSTGAPHKIVSLPTVEKAVSDRPNRPLVIMDIAVPRDVEARVANLSGVSLYDIDTLNENLEVSLAKREHQVPRVEQILAEEKDQFLDYLQTLDVVPVIVSMREQADLIREAELEKTLRKMPELSPEQQERIGVLSKSIMKKLLHSPTMRLREVAGSSEAADYADITRGLFGLD